MLLAIEILMRNYYLLLCKFYTVVFVMICNSMCYLRIKYKSVHIIQIKKTILRKLANN